MSQAEQVVAWPELGVAQRQAEQGLAGFEQDLVGSRFSAIFKS